MKILEIGDFVSLAQAGCDDYFRNMSALSQIQESVGQLSGDEKKALALWLNSQVEPDLSVEDERRLFDSLDEAIQAVDSGKGSPIEEVRRRVSSWAAK